MEYWARCGAGPAQPEVEKEKAARVQSLKPQAPSAKLQAPSKKELDAHKIPDIKLL